jgi:hypothetical protein
MVASFFVSLYMGILFSGTKTTVNGAVYSIGAIFFLVFVLVIPMQVNWQAVLLDILLLCSLLAKGPYELLILTLTFSIVAHT